MSGSGVPINDVEHLRDVLGLLGSLQETSDDVVEIAVIGGSALLLNGTVSRGTRDDDGAWYTTCRHRLPLRSTRRSPG